MAEYSKGKTILWTIVGVMLFGAYAYYSYTNREVSQYTYKELPTNMDKWVGKTVKNFISQ